MDAFDYLLPEEAIAQEPVEPRHAARLLVATGDTTEHHRVVDLPELVGPGDLIVVNETRVSPARLRLRKETGGSVEVLLLERAGADRWDALVRPGRRVPPGTTLWSEDGPAVRVGDRRSDGRREVRLIDPGLPDRAGAVPLPPYIHGSGIDPARYQTVYARSPGSVAAPTAGLHLTDEVLDRCRQAGALVATVDLSVGLDTFRPVAVEDPADHVMHSERYRVPPETLRSCRSAQRVLAVGTTTVRALEAAAATGRLEGRTDLFIRPGFRFRVVDRLMTNFHLPRSSLLLLLAAFCGPRWAELYSEALAAGYRFLSFGDAMLVDRR